MGVSQDYIVLYLNITPFFVSCRSYLGSLLFIITEKARVKERKRDGVGVMKDKELNLEDVKVPHTLG